MGRTYTDENRADALTHFQAVGGLQAARDLGIPTRTIYDWASHAGLTAMAEDEKTRTDRMQIKRQAIREMLLDRLLDLLDRLEGGSAREIQAVAVSIGILIDKYRLEMGEATSRTYIEGRDDIDRSVAQLVEELQRSGQAPA